MFAKKWQIFIIFSLSLMLLAPWPARAITKKANYQDFTVWYQKKFKLKTIPYRAAALFDAKTLQPLYFYQENRLTPTASLIKLVTAGTVLKYKPDWTKPVNFTAEENFNLLQQYVEPGDKYSHLLLEGDETITFEQGFATMLIASTNNGAAAMPRWLDISREEFIKEMRLTAIDWGLKNTTIVEPSGLSLDNTSTAYDMALAACRAFTEPQISKYSSKPFISYNLSSGRHKLIRHTVHDLRRYPKRYYGAKTGYLTETKYHISTGLYTPQGRKVCGAVLSVEKQTESERIMATLATWAGQMYRWK